MLEKWVSRLIMAAGLSIIIAGILTYTYYDVRRDTTRTYIQFAVYPYRQYSASLLFGGFASLGIGFALLWHAETETTLPGWTRIWLLFLLVCIVPLLMWVGTFIGFDAGPTLVTDEQQLQTFFTSLVLLPVLFIAVLVVLDRLAHRLAHKGKTENSGTSDLPI